MLTDRCAARGRMHTRVHLADRFRTLGVRPGDVVFLHASVRAVGPVAGGPDQIHLALKDALTPADKMKGLVLACQAVCTNDTVVDA